MADTRCANPELQLEVDEMMLEYLLYNTLKACIDDWDFEYRENSGDERSGDDTASKVQAPALLAILDTTVHLFKFNHPGHPFSENTAFYFKLLEFLLLFSHKRGGPSVLSEGSYSSARDAGEQNIERRVRCWEAHVQLSVGLDVAEEQLLSVRSVDTSKPLSTEGDQGVFHKDAPRGVPLVDLLPVFMELSAEIVKLTQTDVSSMWLRLACEFMTQAAIEVALRASTSSQWTKIDHETRMACFGWGLPIEMSDFSLVMGVEDLVLAETEKKIHHMLRSTEDDDSSQTAPWDDQRREAIEEVTMHTHQDTDARKREEWQGDDTRERFLDLQTDHPVNQFEIQILHYVKNLQKVWAQLNEEPILLQIEQGRLEGLDEEEFYAFMERVGSDEHEAILECIKIPTIPKI